MKYRGNLGVLTEANRVLVHKRFSVYPILHVHACKGIRTAGSPIEFEAWGKKGKLWQLNLSHVEGSALS